MKEVMFALRFTGSAKPVPGSDTKLRATSMATSQALRTLLKAEEIQSTVERTDDGSARFESEVRIIGEGAFLESGKITYGNSGSLSFRTVVRGLVGASPVAGLQRGGVIWEVTGGTGRLAGAQGLITSNFTVGPEGQVVNDHLARLFLPS